MVLAVFLHMLRVFFTGAYRAQRSVNWLVGWSAPRTLRKAGNVHSPLAVKIFLRSTSATGGRRYGYCGTVAPTFC